MRPRWILFGWIAASGVAYATPTIDVDGPCPAVTIEIEGASPRREVMLVTGDLAGTTTLTRGLCAGTTLDVADAEERGHRLFIARTDGTGAVTLTPASLGPEGCGAGVQGIDLSTCEVTEAVQLAFECDEGLRDDLLAYWPGDGHARDVVGRHRGTIEGTLTYAPGVVGDAFDFDGSTAIRIFATDFQFGHGVPFTFSMWVYSRTSSTSPHHLFGMRSGCTGGLAFDYQYVVQFGDQGGGAYSCGANAGFQPPVYDWQHIVSMYDGASWSLYIDGELAGTSHVCEPEEMPVLGGPLRIGNSGTCEGWVGLVDEVKLWDRALDEDEILCAGGLVRRP